MADLRQVRFESTALDSAPCEVKELEGEDELNRLFSFTVTLLVPGGTPALGLDGELLRSPATLVFEESGEEVAWVHGLVAEVHRLLDLEQDGALFSVTVVPRAWILTRTRRSEIFLHRTVPQILAATLAGAGLEEGEDFVLLLRGRYLPRELVVQYGESDFDFVSRLCEDLGIVFFFRHRDGRDQLVMTDTPDAFEPIARPRPELRSASSREPNHGHGAGAACSFREPHRNSR